MHMPPFFRVSQPSLRKIKKLIVIMAKIIFWIVATNSCLIKIAMSVWYISMILFLTVFDPSIEDSDEYKKVHKEYKAVVSLNSIPYKKLACKWHRNVYLGSTSIYIINRHISIQLLLLYLSIDIKSKYWNEIFNM